MAWAALADFVPLYPLYALLFADSGLSDAEISALFAVWSAVGIVAEVPSGALADRFSRRSALVAAGLLQAAAYVLWITVPGFAGFAAGFVVWGVGGSLSSGTFQALIYDGLAATGAEARYATVIGRTEAAGFAVQVPVALAATGLFAAGGYPLVGWVSVGCCLAAAAVARLLPDVRSGAPGEPRTGYLNMLRTGLAEATVTPSVRGAALAVALLFGLDGLEEYFPVLAERWGVPSGLVPLAILAIPVVGAVGSTLGGWGARLPAVALRLTLLASALAFGAAVLAGHPVGLVGLTVCYGLLRLVQVVADARLQDRISGPARATVTSVATFGGELTALVLFLAWAVGGDVVVAALMLAVAVLVCRWLGPPSGRLGGGSSDSGPAR